MGNSTFYMLGGWDQVNSTVKGAAEFKKGDTQIRVQELTLEQFNSNYALASKQKTDFNVTVETRSMSGIEAKIVRTTNNTNGNIYDYYFIQKDGKYYQITAWDNTSKSSARLDVDNAVVTIISTLKSVVQNKDTNTSSSTNNNQSNSNISNNNNNNNNNNNQKTGDVCPTCQGAGVVPKDPSNKHTTWTTCPTCGGSGYV